MKAILKDYTGENVPNGNESLPHGSILKQILAVQLFARDNLANAADKALNEEQSFGNVERILAKRRDNTEDWLERMDGVEKYFLGATALDCSLMMTFQKVAGGSTDERHTIDVDGEKFVVSMTVMDLDPKADSHPIKYVKQTRMSYKAHRDFVANSTIS